MNTKQLYPILFVIFTNILGAGVIIPILPLYAEGEFHGSVPQITLLASAFFGAQFLAAPWLGRLSDRHGRRPVLLLSQLGTLLAFIIFIFAGPLGKWVESFGLNLPLSGGMLMLFVARLIDGITGGNITTAQAYISDITPEENRAQGLGLLQAAFGVGFIFGPAFGGVLATYGARAPFIGAALITVATLLLTLFTLEESLPEEERAAATNKQGRRGLPWKVVLATRALTLVLLIGFLASLAFSALPATFSLYADHVLFAATANPERIQLYIGLMLTFNGLTQVVTQLVLVRRLVQRFGERRLLILGEISISLAFLGIGLAGSPAPATALLGLFAFGFGVSEPSTQALVTRFGAQRARGHLLGLYQSARSLALIVGPIWAGYAFEAISPQAVFFVGSGLMLCALVAASILLRTEIKPISLEAI